MASANVAEFIGSHLVCSLVSTGLRLRRHHWMLRVVDGREHAFVDLPVLLTHINYHLDTRAGESGSCVYRNIGGDSFAMAAPPGKFT